MQLNSEVRDVEDLLVPQQRTRNNWTALIRAPHRRFLWHLPGGTFTRYCYRYPGAPAAAYPPLSHKVLAFWTYCVNTLNHFKPES